MVAEFKALSHLFKKAILRFRWDPKRGRMVPDRALMYTGYGDEEDSDSSYYEQEREVYSRVRIPIAVPAIAVPDIAVLELTVEPGFACYICICRAQLIPVTCKYWRREYNSPLAPNLGDWRFPEASEFIAPATEEEKALEQMTHLERLSTELLDRARFVPPSEFDPLDFYQFVEYQVEATVAGFHQEAQQQLVGYRFLDRGGYRLLASADFEGLVLGCIIGDFCNFSCN